MASKNRRRVFHVTFRPDDMPRVDLCPVEAWDDALHLVGRAADLSLGGSAVLFPEAIDPPLLGGLWVVRIALPKWTHPPHCVYRC
jgi:hypothetical protein